MRSITSLQIKWFVWMTYNVRSRAVDKSILQSVGELCHARAKPRVCVNLNKPTWGLQHVINAADLHKPLVLMINMMTKRKHFFHWVEG